MKYDFDVTSKFVERCNTIEMNFSFDLAESFHDGKLHHDSNYKEVHVDALIEYANLIREFGGKVPQPLFSDCINALNETINTDCGW
jgi:hypothetical protein